MEGSGATEKGNRIVNKMPDENTGEKAPAGSALPCLKELAGDLDASMKEAEPHFLELGERLTAVFGDADALVKSVSGAAGHFGDSGEGGLSQTVDRVSGLSLDLFRGHRGTMERRLSDLDRSTGLMKQLLVMCDGIRRNTRFLNIVGLNLGIETGRSEEAAELFAGFGQRTRELAGNMGQMLGRIHDRALGAREDQLLAHGEIAASIEAFSQLSDSAEAAVADAAESIAPLMARSLEALEKAERGSREIFNQVGEIVMSIQFHDIARQQVEHIADGLLDAEKLMSEAREQGKPAPEKMAGAHLLVSLQASQLENVIEELRKARDNFRASFGNIGEGIRELGETLASPGGADSGQAGMESRMASLKEGLENLREIMSRRKEMEERVRETMVHSSRAASELSGYAGRVREHSDDLKMIALNAMVMTRKLGDRGATLGVLAREVRNMSDESGSMVSDFVNVLDSISELSGSGGDGESDAGEAGAADRFLHEEILGLGAGIDESLGSAEGTALRAETLKSDIEEVRSGLSFLNDLQGRMKQCRGHVLDAVEGLSPWANGAGSVEGMETAASRYTMDSERLLHEQMVGGAKAAERASAVHGPGAHGDSMELFDDAHGGVSGDNIELFDDASVDVSGDNIELFDDASGDVSGDNIELFDGASGDVSGDNIELFGDAIGDVSSDNIELFDDLSGDVSGDNIELFDDASGDVSGENIELFDDPSGDASGDNIELFDDAPGGVSGDNIELFGDVSGDVSSDNIELFDDASGDVSGDNIELF